MLPSLFSLVLFLVVSPASSSKLPATNQSPTDEPFPLSAGTTWVYHGTVRWTKAGTDIVTKHEITWEMKISDVRTLGKARMARLRGHPSDLAWYDEGKSPGEYLLLSMEGRRFYLLSGPVLNECWLESSFEKLESDVAKWADFLFLDLPLEKGKRFGRLEMLKREDTLYAWLVQDARPANLSNVSGAQRATAAEEFELILRAMNEHQIMSFVSGVGITRYQYRHHGTVSEADVRLVEFRLGPSTAKDSTDALAVPAH
jgi:hypothetical protein